MFTPTISRVAAGVEAHTTFGYTRYVCADCDFASTDKRLVIGHRVGKHGQPERVIETRGRLGTDPAVVEANVVRKQLGREINRLNREIEDMRKMLDRQNQLVNRLSGAVFAHA